jgi:hypothetical protein
MALQWQCSWSFLIPLFWVITIVIGCCAILPWGIYELRKTGEETHVQVVDFFAFLMTGLVCRRYIHVPGHSNLLLGRCTTFKALV